MEEIKVMENNNEQVEAANNGFGKGFVAGAGAVVGGFVLYKAVRKAITVFYEIGEARGLAEMCEDIADGDPAVEVMVDR